MATAALYPKLNLLGGFGFQSSETGNLFDTASQAWSLGPQLTLPLFQGGRLRAGQAAAEARLEGTLARYEQTILIALTEAETAYALTRESRRMQARAEEAHEAAAKAAELARVLHREGLTANLDRLVAEAQEAEAALAAVNMRTAARLAHTRLIRALGGGTGEPQPTRRPAPPPRALAHR